MNVAVPSRLWLSVGAGLFTESYLLSVQAVSRRRLHFKTGLGAAAAAPPLSTPALHTHRSAQSAHSRTKWVVTVFSLILMSVNRTVSVTPRGSGNNRPRLINVGAPSALHKTLTAFSNGKHTIRIISENSPRKHFQGRFIHTVHFCVVGFKHFVQRWWQKPGLLWGAVSQLKMWWQETRNSAVRHKDNCLVCMSGHDSHWLV